MPSGSMECNRAFAEKSGMSKNQKQQENKYNFEQAAQKDCVLAISWTSTL